jgi:hypothetical protein
MTLFDVDALFSQLLDEPAHMAPTHAELVIELIQS